MAVVAVAATGAFFSDTETSTGNTFTAGDLDLTVDNTSYLNGILNQATTWTIGDLTNQLFFNFSDLKPGDEGEDTVSVHVSNDAWACVDLTITENDDETCTSQEQVNDPTCGEPDGDLTDGDLAQALNFLFWIDDGNNVLETEETVLTSGPASDVLNGVTWILADSVENNVGGSNGSPLVAGTTYFIGKAWCFGELSQSPVNQGDGTSPIDDPGVTCNGVLVNNAAQTDKLMGDISFYAEQYRNNPTFQCGL